MQLLLYFLIALGATTAGSLTGMGGGVIIKPLLDAMGDFDVATIGVLSGITVFSMALVSIVKQISGGARLNLKIALPLAIGSVVGGTLGQSLFDWAATGLSQSSMVTALQNGILSLLIVAVFIYMRNKSKNPGFHLTGMLPSAGVGLILGVISSFLGIGGGPINVALIIIVFSFETKTAALCSIVAILFSQTAKLGAILLTTGFGGFDLRLLPPMVVGAILGGFLGANFSKKLSQKAVETCFNAIQLLVLALCIVNIARTML